MSSANRNERCHAIILDENFVADVKLRVGNLFDVSEIVLRPIIAMVCFCFFFMALVFGVVRVCPLARGSAEFSGDGAAHIWLASLCSPFV
jgi:hypothetical protein